MWNGVMGMVDVCLDAGKGIGCQFLTRQGWQLMKRKESWSTSPVVASVPPSLAFVLRCGWSSPVSPLCISSAEQLAQTVGSSREGRHKCAPSAWSKFPTRRFRGDLQINKPNSSLSWKNWKKTWRSLTLVLTSGFRCWKYLPVFWCVRWSNTSNKLLQLATQHCCVASWKALLHVLTTHLKHCHATKFRCIKLNWRLLFSTNFFNLQQQNFDAWECLRWVVIRATTQCCVASWRKMSPVLPGL